MTKTTKAAKNAMTAVNIGRQSGLSIVEFMIAITLSMMMVAGATEIMLSSKQTYNLNDDLSRIQENGRIALDLMAADIRNGGNRGWVDSRTLLTYNYPFLSVANADVAGTGTQILCGVTWCSLDGDGIWANSDRLAVVLDPTDDQDCTGTAVPAAQQIANVYSVALSYTDVATGVNVFGLVCQGYQRVGGNLWATIPGSRAQVLVDGIDSMHILYGVDVDDGLNPAGIVDTDSVVGVSYFRSAGSMQASDWARVRAVRISLLVSNGLGQGAAVPQVRSFQVADSDSVTFDGTIYNEDGPGVVSYEERHMREIYTTTVALPNLVL